jgi:glycine/D-amino acid oxidase-like deaminating enzyme
MSAQRSVVVVGSGAAGMAAAVAAATSGARVTVLEASDRLGGTTATSGGAIWIPANPWAAAHGVEDSVEQGIRYVRAVQAGGGGIDSVGVAYVHEGLRVTRLVEERTPLRWAHLAGFPDYHAELDGGSRDGRGLEIQPVQVSREVAALLREDPYNLPPLTVAEGELPEPPDAAELARREAEGVMLRGRGLVGALADTVLAHGGELRTGCRATTLSIAVASGSTGRSCSPAGGSSGTRRWRRRSSVGRCSGRQARPPTSGTRSRWRFVRVLPWPT